MEAVLIHGVLLKGLIIIRNLISQTKSISYICQLMKSVKEETLNNEMIGVIYVY